MTLIKLRANERNKSQHGWELLITQMLDVAGNDVFTGRVRTSCNNETTRNGMDGDGNDP